MKESLVQWTLLKNLDYLSESLEFRIAEKKGQEINTDYGRIDFILEDFRQNQLIVELETILDSRKAREYCFKQILEYKNVKYVDHTKYCILFAEETDLNSKKNVENFGTYNGITTRTYSLNYVKQLYKNTVRKLCLSFGLSLPSPTNYTICYLRWLNKIMKPYRDYVSDVLSRDKLSKYFNSPYSTNFRCYFRLAIDFEMIEDLNGNYMITELGKQYIKNFNPDIDLTKKLSSVELTNEQRRILLHILTNGNWTKHKVNVFWFLRFLEVTNGDWIPNVKNFANEKLDLANELFGVKYKLRTMYEFLNFASNWCYELRLIDRIKINSKYDRIFLTPLGIEINNIFGLDLQLKKSRLNLNFKYADL